MPDASTAARLRAAVELASRSVAAMQAFDDPTLWTGPAASTFRSDLDERRTRVRAALGAARAAADELAAAAAAAEPGG
jgi:hypothetical protein